MSTTGIEIRRFVPSDEQGVSALILPIQREEFDIAITAEDQPDLKAIPEFYQTGAGDFWVAVNGEQVIGSIALKDIGSGQAALRKMFVAAPFRGREFSVAARLLSRLIEESTRRGVAGVFLGTTDKFLAAHRFYEKHGFREILKEELPASFPLIAVDSKFYALSLNR
ncbi:GNAT family N-acetyltransferase [Pseudomonas syringae]|uniref:Acetyltransferase n=3 Tax=Pseudomonas syringae TaxID=317 RepID=A0A656JMZ8_PSESF|nr:GNAT family N-acetyltransferase [Pseudomonas syringae]EPN38464.1 acetyltransferase [Pseudomonas syringae pv. actinidiae ICMP 19096]EPM51231.1 acetyltransferase [Pseudomonas syringae pv. actinidiae ICMP 19098]EPN17635.1 acetyltransferase [Pseudomonas syringae pv. actinidiae ICMP 18804]EPN21242.1 acetyltransferase [Pseudomonas syringae pv. actinidiae ICMP 19100]EPN28808.1 acetyltransferase [Pseudomonas syringae pv. actinidiae ICMP 19099]